ncbi:hypothetical protein ACWCPM_29315 [Streptomyces sp. NPDC002309]
MTALRHPVTELRHPVTEGTPMSITPVHRGARLSERARGLDAARAPFVAGAGLAGLARPERSPVR